MHYAALMDAGTNLLAQTIGARVRQERLGKGWTLDQLAAAAEVSRRMVVNVEQGATNPSVGTLLRLSEALGVGLPALVEPPTANTVKVTRNGEGAVLWTGKHGGCGILVGGTQSPEVIELWDWSLGAGDHHASKPHAPGTREIAHVLEGAMLITVGEEAHTLETGDALTFPGDVAHSYENPHTTTARFSLTVFEPGVGATR